MPQPQDPSPPPHPLTAWLTGAHTPGWLVATASVAALTLTGVLHVWVGGTLGVVAPDLLHPATPSTLAAHLAAMPEAARQAYVRTAWLDVLYPLAYTTALSGLLARLARPAAIRRGLPWLPLVAAGADLLENALFVGLASHTLPATGLWLTLGSAANGLKWLAVDITLVALALEGARRLREAWGPAAS